MFTADNATVLGALGHDDQEAADFAAGRVGGPDADADDVAVIVDRLSGHRQYPAPSRLANHSGRALGQLCTARSESSLTWCIVEPSERRRCVVTESDQRSVSEGNGNTLPHLSTLEPDSAPKEVVDVYHDFQRRMGFPAAPNFIKTQGHSLAVVHGTWGLVQHVLIGGLLPRTLKEMMFVAISQARKCRYCEAAHLACCRMLGVEPAQLELLVANVPDISPPKVREIILFGLKCAENPQSLSEGDFERLRRHGLRESEIAEVISMSALAVYANIIADATGMQADEMFTHF